MEIYTEALQTPKVEISEGRHKTPPLLIPPESVDSYSRRSSKQNGPSTKESDPDIGDRRNRFMDLGDFSDNEFILLPPIALPDLSIKTNLQPQGELDDCSEYDAMEVEAINYHIESSLGTELTLTRGRSVTLVEDSPSPVFSNRFRLPRLRLQPRGWTRSAGREAPWESFNSNTFSE